MLKIKKTSGYLKYFLIILLFLAVSFEKAYAEQSLSLPAVFLKKIELKEGIYKSVLDTNRYPDFFREYTKYYYKNQEIRFASGSTLNDYLAYSFDLEKRQMWGVDKKAVQDYILKELASKYNRTGQNVRIFKENNQIQFEGMAVDGREIDVKTLTALLINAFYAEKIDAIILPFQVVPSEVKVENEELRNLGIQELVSTGESNFSGSSWMRINNIRIGLSRFNGVLIPQGEIFSIGQYLGEVSARMGYKKELVIKGDRTIPEYGGGLCQVSTTSFRGALQAGFEIIERWPHAYAVSYYEPYGTDATIYLPSKDLKFKNNTSGAILIQTHIDEENTKAYFKYYGTKDSRKVNILGPYLSNYRSAGETRYEVNPNLKPGEKKILGQPHKGFDAFWYRSVDLNPQISSGSNLGTGSLSATGASLVDRIFSRYKPTAWFYQVAPNN